MSADEKPAGGKPGSEPGQGQPAGATAAPARPLSPAEVQAQQRAEARARAEAQARAELLGEKPAASKTKAASDPVAEQPQQPQARRGQSLGQWFKLRRELGGMGRLLMGSLCLGLILAGWWLATRGAVEERLVGPGVIGSPAEVFGSFKSLWFDRALSRNTMASLVRILEGYGLALLVGIPLGIMAGCFRALHAFLAPVNVFFRNVPVAALLPLTILWFGIDEQQKVVFLFIACVAFVIASATDTIAGVDEKYLDTAYTLGASRWQIISKVLVPLALPELFNSMRLLFGLAFGYIILAEVVNMDSGLGMLITMSQRRGPRDHVYLCLLVIALLAYLLDRVLFWTGKQLFPYRFRG